MDKKHVAPDLKIGTDSHGGSDGNPLDRKINEETSKANMADSSFESAEEAAPEVDERDFPREIIPGFHQVKPETANSAVGASGAVYASGFTTRSGASSKYVSYTIKLPSEQLAALQNIWLELKKLYGTHSPDKSGMIQLAIQDWLKRWDGPDKQKLLNELLEIREDTRRRQYKKG